MADDTEKKRPDAIDWGIVGENVGLRAINTADPIDLERYWITNKSVAQGVMVDDIESMEELIENAKYNGRNWGYTFAISGTAGEERSEFQGFVQFTADRDNELRNKIEGTGVFQFSKDVLIWEVSYAKYPPAAPHQIASGVRQGCVLLLGKLKLKGFYPRLAILASVDPNENAASLRVLASACFDPIASTKEKPIGIIKYDDQAQTLDSVWLLNWNRLDQVLRKKATPQWEHFYRAV
jgi:hypothetical protein